jgi:AbrB family looped-hinge helix DNA binding protein
MGGSGATRAKVTITIAAQSCPCLTSDIPYGISNAMNATITMDGVGRVVLPKQVRQQMHLTAGDQFALELVPDGIMLRSRSRRTELVEENGLLVHEGEPAGDLARAVDLVRARRDDTILGLKR